MAVTVEQVPPNLVLDEDDRIVEVGPAAEAGFGPLVGRNLWECFPGAKPLYGPYYERARQTGEPVEFAQFYNGHVGQVRAVPYGRRLALFWEVLCRLDTLTLDGLYASLGEAMAALEECEGQLRRKQMRDSLRVIDGGV